MRPQDTQRSPHAKERRQDGVELAKREVGRGEVGRGEEGGVKE